MIFQRLPDRAEEASIFFSEVAGTRVLRPLSLIRSSSLHRSFHFNRDESKPRKTIQIQRGAAMDVRMLNLDGPLFSSLQHLIDTPDEMEKAMGAPSSAYVRDAKAMAFTPADVKELPDAYVFVVDMPGLKPADVKVLVEDDRVLVVSSERKRQDEEGKARYLRMERRVGKFMRKFALPDNADVDAVSAVCLDGVLTVTVKKVPPPEPKKPKTVEIEVA